MNALDKEIKKTEKAELKFKSKAMASFPYKDKLMQHIPEKLQNTLDLAFEKAFETAFLKGTALLEKTYNKEDLVIEFESKQLMVDRKTNRKHIKNMDKSIKKSAFFHDVLSTSSGTIMGVLGLGLPDIPVLVSILLRQIYICALQYGFDYESDMEKIFILRLIREALHSETDQIESLHEEIIKTSHVLSEKLLVEKFIQGIPIVGAAGGIVNHQIIRRISKFAQICYKKRWLNNQINRLK